MNLKNVTEGCTNLGADLEDEKSNTNENDTQTKSGESSLRKYCDEFVYVTSF